MSQIESGVRSILGYPPIYNTFQRLLGAKAIRREFVDNYVKPKPNDNILDIGCGTAELLEYLPRDISYFGYDQSSSYIEYARNIHGDRGRFECAMVDALAIGELPDMDLVLASGLLHHLDCSEARTLIQTAFAGLKKGGRFIAIDPCYEPGQNFVAKWLIDRDRGSNVRRQSEYIEIASTSFNIVESKVIHRSWIPYTHHIMICQR